MVAAAERRHTTMTCLFLAAALFITAEPNPKTAEDTTNAARALLESARWVEVKDNHGDMEIRVLAAEEEPKAEQAMRDYHDRYQEAADSYREQKKEYADAISELNQQFLDLQESITADHVNQYFRDRRKLKEQLVTKSPPWVVPKPPYRRVLRYGDWWELRFDAKREHISTVMFSYGTLSIYLRLSTASCGFDTGFPGLLDRYPELLDRTENPDIRIEVKKRGIVVKQHQLRLESYRLDQIDAAEAVASLKEAVPNAEICYNRELNTILVFGFPDEHKAIEQALAQIRASRRK